MANTIKVACYSAQKPLLKLIMNDAKNPVYHLVFMRRVCRVSSALLHDSVNCEDLLQETMEDLNFTSLDTMSVSFLSLLFFVFLFSPKTPIRHERETRDNSLENPANRF